MSTKKYLPQKKYLEKRKQLRVWLDAEKYDIFKESANKNGHSVYGLINDFVDDYLNKNL